MKSFAIGVLILVLLVLAPYALLIFALLWGLQVLIQSRQAGGNVPKYRKMTEGEALDFAKTNLKEQDELVKKSSNVTNIKGW